jgi:hypothetical protein
LKVADEHERYSIWVFADPLFKTPLVLGTNLSAGPEVVFSLYLDRWPVEMVCSQLTNSVLRAGVAFN